MAANTAVNNSEGLAVRADPSFGTDSVVNPSTTSASEADYQAQEDEIDIFGNGLLVKKLISAGSDQKPREGDVVTVSVSCVCEGESADLGFEETTFIPGDGDVVQALDLSVRLMGLGEVAEVKSAAPYAYGSYGLDPDIPPNTNVTFRVGLLSVRPAPDYRTVPVSELIEQGLKKKERGNELFRRREYLSAIHSYGRATAICEQRGGSLSADNNTLQELLDLKIFCYNNLAAAQLKIGEYDGAIRSTDKVLSNQPNNSKALFRKARALTQKGDIEEAVKLLRKARNVDPESTVIQQELNKLLSRRRAEADRERDMYRRMLGTNRDEPKKARSSWTWIGAGLAGLAAAGMGALAYVLYRKQTLTRV